MDKVEIALACDEDYFPGLLGTITSLLASASTNYVYSFHILDGGIEKKSIATLKGILRKFRHTIEINFIAIGTTDFNSFPSRLYRGKMVYARLLLPSLLNIEKVIYIDTDILVLKDISILWQHKLNKHAAVCVDMISTIKNDCPLYKELGLNGDAPYFNSGLMVINLNKFKKDNIATETFDYLNRYHDCCKQQDQSALNVTLYNKVDWVDSSWNTLEPECMFHPVKDLQLLARFDINFHFATVHKPWVSYSLRPEYQMFYALLETIGYSLNQQVFLRKKQWYSKRMKLINILLLYYRIRSIGLIILGKKVLALKTKKKASRWQYEKVVNKQPHDQKHVVALVLMEWKEKILSKLILKNKV